MRGRLALFWLGCAALGCAALGCGGGVVDAGFYGAAEEEAPAKEAQAAPRQADKPRVVIIRASWCPACVKAERALLPVLDANDDKIDVLVLDVSDDDAIRSSRELADRAGVSSFFERYRGITPSVALVARNGRLRHYEGNPYRTDSWRRACAELLMAEPAVSARAEQD
jgi:thiol-disulfide isomerase/thioredoxin